jgi:hypothetical protein
MALDEDFFLEKGEELRAALKKRGHRVGNCIEKRVLQDIFEKGFSEGTKKAGRGINPAGFCF